MQPAYVIKRDMNFGILIYERPGIYSGHWVLEARGRQALDIAKDMLTEAFNSEVEVIMGLSPVHNKAARWFNRQLGFTSHGVVGTDELFILTKEDYTNG